MAIFISAQESSSSMWIAGGHGSVAPFTDLHSHFEN